MRKRFYTLFLVILFSSATGSLMAAIVKGKLLDENKDPMIGAHVIVKGGKQYCIVGLDGSFSISGLPVGSHMVTASFVGYLAQEKEVTITSNDQIVVLEFSLEQDQKMLNEVVVLGSVEGGSELEARNSERNSSTVMNVISARAIEISPDITVANVVQRVSGVSLVRNSNGDPQYAIIRGMDKRYNYTLVNGIKIPSPDEKNRYIPLDIFPASLLERLEVSKTLTPDMEGDAVGGVVNMIMKNAAGQLTVKGDVQVGYNQIFINREFLKFDKKAVDYQTPYDKYGPIYQAQITDFSKKNLDITSVKPLPDILGSVSYGNRFFKGKLGVLVAGSFQNSYRGTNSTWFKVAIDTKGSNAPSLDELQERTYSTQQERYAFHIKSDYALNQRNKIKLYIGNYALKNSQTRDMMVSQLDARYYSAEDGNAILSFKTRTQIVQQNIFNTTLQGDHQLASFIKMNWSAVYSNATNKQPDNAQFETNGSLTNFEQGPVTVERYMPRSWQSSTEQDYAGYLNLIMKPDFLGPQNEISFGGMYRKKDRENFYNKYSFDPAPPTQTKGVDWNTFSDVTLIVINPQGSVYDALNYDAHENVLDYYVQGKFQLFQKVNVVGGFRVENTDQGYTLRFPPSNVEPSLSQIYTDILPSVSVKYKLNDQMNIRSSYFKSISRPGYFEIVPYRRGGDQTDGLPEIGNPELKHARAHNVDLRWEYFPSNFDQILIGAFYKKILDPIEYASVFDATGSSVIQPGNYGTAYNWGIELDYTKYFNKFGVKANYTFTNSTITTTKTLWAREDPNDQSSTLIQLTPNQTRPLQGQAKHIGNLVLLYKDQKSGTNLQLAFVYTGERIESISPYLDNDSWVKPILQLDFSAEQRISKHFELFAKIQNLLNSPYEVIIKKQHLLPEKEYKLQTSYSSTLIRRDEYYQSYRLGVRYTL
ncbi:MAG: TonB-dependent receptor [Chryseolinea sp.]